MAMTQSNGRQALSDSADTAIETGVTICFVPFEKRTKIHTNSSITTEPLALSLELYIQNREMLGDEIRRYRWAQVVARPCGTIHYHRTYNSLLNHGRCSSLHCQSVV
jgi:hypothetical protein